MANPRLPDAAQLERWTETALARVGALESERPSETSWSPRLAFDAALRFLAILDTYGVAEECSARAAQRIEDIERRARFVLARSEALRRMDDFIPAAIGATLGAAKLDASAAVQRAALQVIDRAAREVRDRAAVLAPDAERALRSIRSIWNPPDFAGGEDVLEIFDAVNAGRATINTAATLVTSESFREYVGHWERLGGSPATAPPSYTARIFAGYIGSVRAKAPAWGAERPQFSRNREVIESLQNGATENRNHPLAPLLVLVAAACALPIGERATVVTERGIAVSLRVAMGLRIVAETERYYGPRDHVRIAVELLGHRLSDLGVAARKGRSRTKDKGRRK